MKVIGLENLFSLASGRRGFGREPYFIAPRDCKPRQRVTKCLHSLYVRSRIAGIHHPFAPEHCTIRLLVRNAKSTDQPVAFQIQTFSAPSVPERKRTKENERERERAVSNEIASPTPRPSFSQVLIQQRHGRSAPVHRLNLRLVPPFPLHLAGRDFNLTFEIGTVHTPIDGAGVE